MLPLRACLVSFLLVLATSGQAQAQRFDPTEAAILALRQAVTYQPSGVQHPRLVALRALKDPTLAPVFEGLLESPEAPLRIDGFLGLSELDSERGADPERLRKLGDPALRTVVITECLGLSLLRPEGIRTMLAWDDLTPYDRTLLVAELHRLGEPWELEMLRDAPSTTMADVQGLAALLALQKGDEAGWKTFVTRLGEASEPDRLDLVARLADASRHYGFTAATGPLLDLTRQSRERDRIAAIAAALRLVPSSGRAALLELARADRSTRNLVQCGLLMLAADAAMQPEDFEAIRNGEGLPDDIAEAGSRLLTKGSDPSQALASLMTSVNRQVSEWAVRQAGKLEGDARSRVLLQAIDRLDTIDQPSMHDKLIAAIAANQLLGSEPAELLTRATREGGKPEIPEAIIAAMCDANTPESAAFARMVRGKLSQRGESMALVTLAKASTTLNANELQALGRVAGGGGRVDEPIAMQAAWLYLRHANRLAQATPRLKPR
jgi:hypothetical protein